MDRALQVLMNNYKCKENTFLYKLSEDSFFDYSLFWEYYNCVREVIKETLDKPLDREISRAISCTHGKILEHFIWDYSDTDLYQINNFPYDKVHFILERLNYLVDGYFQGYLLDESMFDEELCNPILSKEPIQSESSLIRFSFLKAGLNIQAVGFYTAIGTYDIYLNEEEDNYLYDTKLSRGEVKGRYLFTAADSCTAHRMFHEWVMKNYSPYSKKNCTCTNTTGIYTVSYSPGSCEAIVKCTDCGAFYYHLLFERMSIDGEDTMEDYLIPIAEEEKEMLIKKGEREPDLSFFTGRQAKCIYNNGTTGTVSADLALERCGRLI